MQFVRSAGSPRLWQRLESSVCMVLLATAVRALKCCHPRCCITHNTLSNFHNSRRYSHCEYYAHGPNCHHTRSLFPQWFFPMFHFPPVSYQVPLTVIDFLFCPIFFNLFGLWKEHHKHCVILQPLNSLLSLMMLWRRMRIGFGIACSSFSITGLLCQDEGVSSVA